jgi:hypothetical protein
MLLLSRSLCCGSRRSFPVSLTLPTWRDYSEHKTKNKRSTTKIFVWLLFHFSLTSPLTLIETRSALRFVVFLTVRVYLPWGSFLPSTLNYYFFRFWSSGCDATLHGVTTERSQSEKKYCHEMSKMHLIIFASYWTNEESSALDNYFLLCVCARAHDFILLLTSSISVQTHKCHTSRN